MITKTAGTVFLSGFYILGLAAYYNNLTLFFAGGLFFVLIFLLFKNAVSNKFAVVLYLVFMLGIANCAVRNKDIDGLGVLAPQYDAVLMGTVVSSPTTNNPSKTKFYLTADKMVYGEKTLFFETEAKTIVTVADKTARYGKIKVGDELEIKGMLFLAPKATNPSQFDYSKYLKNKKVFTTFYAKDDCFKIVSGPKELKWKFLQSLDDIKIRIIKSYSTYIKSPNIEVLGGIILGDDAVNPPDYIKASFINSGLFHILAASGMNVALIFGLWFFFMQRLRMNQNFSIFTGMIIVAFYTCMTGFPPSILRAALMIEFVLLGKLIDKQADSAALLSFVAFLLLLYDPGMLNEIGFQLSFVVTLGLIVMCSGVIDVFNKKLPKLLSEAIVIPTVAQLWVLPIQMFYFNSFALYSIFANIAMLPFLTVTSFLGFVGFVLAPIPMIGDKCALIFSFVLNLTTSALVWVSNFFASLPHSLLVTFKPGIFQIIIYYSLLFTLVYLIKNKFENKKAAIFGLTLLALLGLSLIKLPDNKCEVLFFDVENAQSILIKSPKGMYFLVDTGRKPYSKTYSQAQAIIGKYMKDKGIKSLNALILTSFDDNHAGGAVQIMEHFRIKKAVFNAPTQAVQSCLDIQNYARERKIECQKAQNNTVLYSEKDFEIKEFVSKENHKIINLITYKNKRVLLTSDADARTLSEFKEYLPDKIDIIQIGSHGVVKSIDSKLLKSLNPDSVIISGGQDKDNNPGLQTLFVPAKNKMKIYRTDCSGAIKVIIGKDYCNILKHSGHCNSTVFCAFIKPV